MPFVVFTLRGLECASGAVVYIRLFRVTVMVTVRVTVRFRRGMTRSASASMRVRVT